MGDVAGVGPEILARAWPELVQVCRPVVVGDPGWMTRSLRLTDVEAEVCVVQEPDELEPREKQVPCILAGEQKLEEVTPGVVDPRAGRAAYDFVCKAVDLTLEKKADGIVTAPMHKKGLHAAGLKYPGHTEILAERAGTRLFGMVLYAKCPQLPHGLAVVHVTLHMRLKQIFKHVSTTAVLEKIQLLQNLLPALSIEKPRLAVAALNPHASDGGLFGDEEMIILEPAVVAARSRGIDVRGPLACDTLFGRAQRGEFNGIIAMYHDQGHIPMKLLGGFHAVNISVGLPLVRTSVAHGTAYDIAGKGQADCVSLIEAAKVASQLASG